MPALPNIPLVLRAQLHWQDNADTHVTSTLFFRYSGTAPNGTACNALAHDIDDAFAPVATQWSNETSLIGCVVTDLSTNMGGEGSDTTSVPGTDSGTQLAGGTCLIANYQIGRRYRGGKPRNYFPWGTSSDLNGRQLWTTSFASACQSALSDAIAAITGESSGGTTITAHCNVSYYQGSRVVTSPTTGRARNVPILRTTPQVDDITGITINPAPGSQRRRNRGA